MTALPQFATVRYGYNERRTAILAELAQGDRTTLDIATELGISLRNAGEALQRLADRGDVWVPRRVGKAHVWALAGCGQPGEKRR